ncbi:chromosome segregation protein SMC [Exiguobacterium sp. SH0S7]|uniref:AAA family ATPase n=1 Tax=Exiguobacterium sp. SH0S7 TaxID=2510951 RepID=UPI00103F5252|nr:AAA family ATPase [Exiguobacterium sp. SH0S7]TCI72198.1 chromosome segregation protein SMC [Exiguobacterium sp. SH0S7]
MILKQIVIENFRQYYRQNEVEFAHGSSKNVTVIHGENGSGKTALLTALIWGFYGRELKLPNPESIFNNKAIQESTNNRNDLSTSVQIKFEHNEYEYELCRVLYAKFDNEKNVLNLPKNKTINQKVELTKRNVDTNQSTKIKDISYEINRILPYKLHTFFFFDGERMDHLGKKEAYMEIRDSIKRMMGLELFDNSIEHLSKTIIKLRDEVSKNVKSELSEKYVRINQIEDDKGKKKHRLAETKQELTAAQNELKSIENALRNGEETRTFQVTRDHLVESIIETKNAFDDKLKELRSLLSRSGHLAFSTLPLKRFQRIAHSDSRDTIEKLIHPELIPSLLSNGKCLCGHELETAAISTLEKVQHEVLDLSSSKNEMDHLYFQLSGWEVARTHFYVEIRRLVGEREELRETLRSLEDELREIEERMKSSSRNIENSTNLIERESLVRTAIVKAEANIEDLLRSIEEISREEEQLNKEVSKLTKAEERQLKLQLALDSATKVKNTLVGLLKLRESQVKSELEEKIKLTYSQLLRKEYPISLTDNYELLVSDVNGGSIGLSQGESQITSLAFIGAIVDLTREYKDKEKGHALDEELKLGNIFPLVMDSPFGALDADHRSRVATNLPKLSDQVVVIVSTSQWRGEVDEAINHRIGKSYKLLNHTNDESGEYTEIAEVM